MRRALALVLATLMCIGCVAFAEGEETYTSIPLGGRFDDFELEGLQFGVYTKMDVVPECMDYGDDTKTDVYFCEDAPVRYISVHRWANTKNQTALEIRDEGAKISQALESEMVQDSFVTIADAEYRGYEEALNCYYSCFIMLDDTDAVVMVFYYGCEEVPVIEDKLYAYIPLGYSDVRAIRGEIVDMHAYYDFGGLPSFWFGKNVDTYEGMVNLWIDQFETFPVSKEQYEEWDQDGWTAEEKEQFYAALGTEVLMCDSFDYEGFHVDYQVVWDIWEEDVSENVPMSVIYDFPYDGILYQVWVTATDDMPPYFALSFANSMHVKQENEEAAL